jgi:hypothetical protein
VKIMLRALAERRIGRRDQANAWIWRMAEYTREVHEEYAVQRWPETKRLLGLLVNSSGGAHGRNARRLVHAARKQDRRLAAALLAAALAHSPEAEEVLRGARTRMARKPPALARELLRNFPKRRGRSNRRRRRAKEAGGGASAGERGQAPDGANARHAERAQTQGIEQPQANGAGATAGDSRDEAPSDAVLTEALTSDAARAAEAGDPNTLPPGADEQLERSVEGALDHAGAEPAAGQEESG